MISNKYDEELRSKGYGEEEGCFCVGGVLTGYDRGWISGDRIYMVLGVVA
ncbi:hypothetical protein KAR91_81510 [Candidatus Pacearchaeota archaeon]|nr:hypothetical protein [Candidatus Pacearchaeota archaeon]